MASEKEEKGTEEVKLGNKRNAKKTRRKTKNRLIRGERSRVGGIREERRIRRDKDE